MKRIMLILALCVSYMLNAAGFMPLPKDFRANPQLHINKIDIDAELCGPLMKSIIEIEFYNPYDRDSLETRLVFETDKESFVKELWLDINGKYKVSESFTKAIGNLTYDLIVHGKRKDPAVLTGSLGKYDLRVFPFKKGEYRKVKIEMYSILNPIEDTLKWSFIPKIISSQRFKEFDINLNLKCNLGNEYEIIGKAGSYDSTVNKNKINYKNKINLKILLKTKNDNVITKEEDIKYLWKTGNDSIQPVEVFYNGSHADFFKSIIENLKNDKIQVIYKNFKHSQTLSFFLEYLKKKKGDIYYYEDIYHEGTRWIKNNDVYELFTIHNYGKKRKLIKVLTTKDNLAIGENKIVCKYLDEYMKYEEIYKLPISDQINSGYLTSGTSKLVLEENDVIQRIREESKKLQEKTLKNNRNDLVPSKYPPPPPPSNPHKKNYEIFDFFSVQNKPALKKGQAEKMKNYITNNYPKIAKESKVSGIVIMKFVCDEKGIPENADIVLEKPSDMGFGQVALDAILKHARFTPVKQRSEPVKVRMSQKISFKANDHIFEYDLSNVEDFYYAAKKVFIINAKDSLAQAFLVEKEYNGQKCVEIKFLSDDYFELIFENIELIDLIWNKDSIIFEHKGKWYRIVQ